MQFFWDVGALSSGGGGTMHLGILGPCYALAHSGARAARKEA